MTTANFAAGAARAREAQHAKRQHRVEDAHDLIAHGASPEDAARHLNVTLTRLHEYLSTPVPPPADPEPEESLPPSPIPALEPERRIARARPIAADLVRCVAARDAEGVRILLHRVRDWHAVAIVLAECAEPARTAAVTQQTERQCRTAA